MKAILPILTLLIQANAHAFNKPDHCEAFDNVYSIRDGHATRDDGSAFGNQDLVSSSCVDQTEINIHVEDLLTSWNKVNDNFIVEKSSNYRRRATTFALKNLMKRSNLFEGLAGSSGEEFKPKLVSCLRGLEPDLADKLYKEREEEKKINKDKTFEFIDTSFDKSILAHCLLETVKDKEDEYEHELEQIKKNKRGLSKDEREEHEKALTLRYEEEKTKYLNSLQQMSISDPLLFTTKNNFSVFDWFNSQLTTSDLANEMVGEIPPSVKSSLMKSIEKPEQLDDFSDYLKVYGGELKDEMSSYKRRHLAQNEQSIKEEVKKASEEFTNDIQDSMLNNCQENGKNLHFNNQLIAGLAEDIFKNNEMTPQEKKEELIGLQAWHCHAWRERPPKEVGQMNWARIGGMASMGLGAALWLTAPFTGVGAIAGTWLVSAGGAALTGAEVNDFLKHNPTYHQQKTAFHMGWRDLSELAKAKDSRTDIISNIGMDLTMTGVGAGMRFVKLPRWLQRGKVAENNKVRETASADEDVENYYSLIMNRHERMVPTEGIRTKVNDTLQRVTGNTDIPKVLLKDDGDFAPMLRILTDTKGKAVDRDLAFGDLQGKIKTYRNYPERVKDAVRNGRNSREILEANKVYGSKLRRKHFVKDSRSGEYPDLPEMLDGYKVERTVNDSIALHYKVVSKGDDGVEKVVTLREDFSNYEDFISFVGDTKKAHRRAFSFDLKDEILRKSDIFTELDDQARLYRELSLVRDGLIKVGKDVDPQTGKYANLTERQNGYIFQLNELLRKSPELLPRQDAVNAFNKLELKAERRALITGNILRSRGGKYSKEATTLAKEKLPSMLRTLAPLGLFTGTFGGTGLLVTSASDRIGARGLVEDMKAVMRDIGRSTNKIFYPEAPVGFTNAEKECAQEARAWSIENACLLTLLNDQVMVKEGIREQLDPSYNMLEDEELMERVRDYIRDFYKLREFFASGKKTQIAQQAMSTMAKEKAEEDLKRFIRDVALNNGLLILDEDGIISKDQADVLRERLFNYEDAPEDARDAYQEIVEAFAKYQGSVIQNPEMPANIKNQISRLIADQVIDDDKAPN